MSDHDEATRVVIVRDGGGAGLGSFFVGALLGAGLALLFAPKSGEETQEELKERARKLKAAAEERVRDAQKQLEGRLDNAREGIHTRVEGVKGAVEAGRQAAVDARDELERKLERSKAAYRAGIDAAREAVTEGADEDREDDA
ncbi:MAG: YtxH domain-containing protein [Gemmatimonadota bacterium]|jgi:gas vesicle protein